MKEKRDCKIVQDLLPNYIEKLTNEETNQYIETHLNECEECREIYDNMKKEIDVNHNKRDEREVKYIKKFSSKLRILKIILLAIVLIYVGIIGYKFVIIKSMQDKVKQYNDITNFHITKKSYCYDTVVTQESFHKDGNYLVHIKRISENNDKKEIISTKSGNNYLTAGETKIAILNSMTIASQEKVYNNLETESVGEFLYGLVISSRISSVKCNDKDCYKIENFKVAGVNFPEYGMCLYIDKETGLIVRSEEGSRDSNGKMYTQVSDYKYEFNTVTDEDLKEPDISEYKVQQ